MTEHMGEKARLTEAERKALSDSLCVRHDFVDEDGNSDYTYQVGHLQHVQPVVERIIAERFAQAKAEPCGCAFCCKRTAPMQRGADHRTCAHVEARA